MTTQFKVCNCNRTMPLDAVAGAKLGAALGVDPPPIATELCRREVGSFLGTIQGVDDVVVACTQERALFSELAQQKNAVAPIRFVNIRETGGWGAQAKQALPKMGRCWPPRLCPIRSRCRWSTISRTVTSSSSAAPSAGCPGPPGWAPNWR